MKFNFKTWINQVYLVTPRWMEEEQWTAKLIKEGQMASAIEVVIIIKTIFKGEQMINHKVLLEIKESKMVIIIHTYLQKIWKMTTFHQGQIKNSSKWRGMKVRIVRGLQWETNKKEITWGWTMKII